MGILKHEYAFFIGVQFCLLAYFTSCSQLRDRNSKVSQTPDVIYQSVSFGNYDSTDGASISLDNSAFESTVLIFASDTCSTCAAKAKYWKQEFQDTTPKNILFVHYIIGGFVEDAADWKAVLGITWPVVTGKDNDLLYRQYCPAIVTPCLVIKNNKTSEVIQTYKTLRKEEIERYTGKWQN